MESRARRGMRRGVAVGAALTWGAVVAACGGEAGAAAGDAFSVRDSAGVRIAESAAPAWTGGERWRLSADPVLRIGMMDGPAPYVFGQISGASRLSDGGVVVADGQVSEVRWFDAAGRHLRTSGRAGDGPGEFRGMSGMRRLRGDTVALGDWSTRRVTLFAPDGTLAGVTPSHRGEGIPMLQGALDDGSLVFLMNHVFGQGDPVAGLHRDTTDVVRLARPGEAWAPIQRVAGPEYYVRQPETGGISVTSPDMGRTTSIVTVGDGYFAATGDAYEITRHAPDGTPVLLIRRPVPNRPFTAADQARVREQRLAMALNPAHRTMLEEALRGVPSAATLPAYDGIVADAEGFLWVREVSVASGEPRDWSVFDPGGRLLGTVTTPAGLRVTEIGSDYLLGVWSDDLGVPHVHLYTLEKP